MTFGEMQAEVRRRLDEVAAVWWTDAEIRTAINDGEDEIADATEWLERVQYIDILEDRPYYDLRTTIRRNFLCAGPTFNTTTNRWLIPISHRDLSLYDRRWEERDAEAEYVMIRGLWWLGLFPANKAAGGSVKQYYRATPEHMVNADDEPGFHRTFHQGLVEYAVADLFAQDNETDLAMRAWAAYKPYEEGLRLYMLGRIQVPSVHASGASAQGSD